VKVTTDESLRTDEAYATVIAAGARHEASVAHATGTVDNPMSDSALERKFRGNAEPVIGGAKTNEVVELVWRLESLSDVRELTALLGV
jgi:2-methylcitrate dehydratase PrpD